MNNKNKKESGKFAAIFDNDGVIADNLIWHRDAWRQFLNIFNKSVSDEEFNTHTFGRTNEQILKHFFGDELTSEQIEDYSIQKEALYRKIYSLHMVPPNGLLDFLTSLKKNGFKTAIASSGIRENVDFTINGFNIKNKIDVSLDLSSVKRHKPFPDVYLDAAKKLGVEPKHCVVFEDSRVGIEAGKRAGMKVVGVATTLSKEELLKIADFAIKDFTEITIEKLHELLN